MQYSDGGRRHGKHSPFDRIKRHLVLRGCNRPVRGALRDDLETVVRRCDDVRGLSPEFGSIELSPYLASLMQVSGAPAEPLEVAGVSAAAGV
jgi:hypothetical protein